MAWHWSCIIGKYQAARMLRSKAREVMKDKVVLVVVVSDSMSDKRDEGIRSRSSSSNYREGWERLFGEKRNDNNLN